MKSSQIILIIMLVVAIGVVISLVSDAGTYSDFANASTDPNNQVRVIGKLDTQKEIIYDTANINEFSFYMTDENGDKMKVIHLGAKPQDFEKSEQVVTTGYIDGDVFISTSLLLKCPSKYNAENKPEKFKELNFSSRE